MKKVVSPLHMKETLDGSVLIPSSKSHTIRALLIASFAEGTSRLINPLLSEDAISCLKICRKLGAEIKELSEEWQVKGNGGRFPADVPLLDVGNSGTSLYLAASLAALGNIPITFDGDEQIRKRSAANLLNSLKDLGADITVSKDNCAPFTITGPLKGGKTSIYCPTSQYLSSLLIAAPLADCEKTEIIVPELQEQPYAEMTLRWLDEQKIQYEKKEMKRFIIPGRQKYRAFEKNIPGDFSSATFFFCAAAICGSEIEIEGVDVTDSQGDKAVLDYLEKMGCTITRKTDSVIVKGNPLTGTKIDMNATPDALPAIAVTACFAKGETRLVNVAQARIKETDRIAVMTTELKKMGADIEEQSDGLIIRTSELTGCAVEGHSDHRVVMAMALAGLKAAGKTTISTADAADITFPGYFNSLDGLRNQES